MDAQKLMTWLLAKPRLRNPVLWTLANLQFEKFGMALLQLPSTRNNPYPFYRRIRELGSVSQADSGLIVSSYADVSSVLRHPAVGQMPGDGGLSMLTMNPPDHGRVRGAVQKGFSPRAMEALRPTIRELTTRMLDAAGPDLELMNAVARPLPVAVICEMLGIPVEEREHVRVWSLTIARSLDVGLDGLDLAQLQRDGAAHGAAFREYSLRTVEARRADPRETVLDQWIADGNLDDAEIAELIILLLVAGHITTTELIGNGVYALSKHPDEWRRLRENPSLIPGAVDEMLRFESPVQLTGRAVLEDAEICGVAMPKGSGVTIMLAAANRDPAQFADPDRLDVGRDAHAHLAFAGGIHFCLGAALARLEAQVVVAELVERMPRLRVQTAPRWRGGVVFRGLKTLQLAG